MSTTKQEALAGTELVELWSVTNALDKGLGVGEAIVQWACEQTAIAAIDKRRTWEPMLEDSGRDETIQWLKRQRWTATKRAKQRGTEVHRVAEALALGRPTPIIDAEVAKEIEPYVEQLVRWLELYRPAFVMAEAPVYNLELGYAGTCDGIFDIEGRGRFIFDYKTNSKGPEARSRPPYSNASLQLAAYAHAEQVGLLADRRYSEKGDRWYVYDHAAEHAPMPKVDAGLCVVVTPYDCYAVPVSIGEIPWRSFQHALALASWNAAKSSTEQALYVNAFGPQWIVP
jgi:hypothetical protein